jgi:hypothetical protein
MGENYFLWEVFFKMAKLGSPTFWLLFSTVKVVYCDKKLVGPQFGRFFTTSSGHPACRRVS